MVLEEVNDPAGQEDFPIPGDADTQRNSESFDEC